MDYNFVSLERFLELEKSGALLESGTYEGKDESWPGRALLAGPSGPGSGSRPPPAPRRPSCCGLDKTPQVTLLALSQRRFPRQHRRKDRMKASLRKLQNTRVQPLVRAELDELGCRPTSSGEELSVRNLPGRRSRSLPRRFIPGPAQGGGGECLGPRGSVSIPGWESRRADQGS